MENQVIISLEKYEELFELKYQIRKKEVEELKKQNNDLKNALLELKVSEWNMEMKDLEDVTDFDSYCFGLNDKLSLLKFFTQDELVEFVKVKYEEIHKKEDETEEA